MLPNAAEHRGHGCGAGGSTPRGEAIERQARERTDAGLPLDGLPDLSAEGERDGFYQAQLIRELAVPAHHELDGRGVGGRTSAADAPDSLPLALPAGRRARVLPSLQDDDLPAPEASPEPTDSSAPCTLPAVGRSVHD